MAVAGQVEAALVMAFIVFGAWAGLARIEPDPAIRARTGGLAGIAGVALAGALLGLALRPGPGPMGWVPAVFTAQLAVAAWIDRQTTWVPDPVGIGLCLVAALAVAAEPAAPLNRLLADRGLGAPPLVFGLAWLAAILGWGAGLAAWRLQTALGGGWLTPPDLVAFLLPLAVFGPGGAAAAAYALTGLLALGTLHLAPLRRALVHPAAAAEGARDLGLEGGVPVPALMLVLPALAAVYLLGG